MSDRSEIEGAFDRIRQELKISTSFPPEVEVEAARAAKNAVWVGESARADLEAIPFVTIDPAGSRDLDQALFIERGAKGYRVLYAIADVACFVERGGVIEQEAWRRGVTYYSPDRRDPLYPPSISQEAGSLLPDAPRPSVVFTIELDERGELVSHSVGRGRVRSRAQLTYPQALEHIEGDGALFREQSYAESLLLLREVGELRIALERARGGVSLPILEQRVSQDQARRLGYELSYEQPSIAEEWNAQISLLAGHVAALRMVEAGVGLLRAAPPANGNDLARVRAAAEALGFDWPDSVSYPDFLHSLEPEHPLLPILVWQARRMMKGADYLYFEGTPPQRAEHAALAMLYAHATAPLRRLADRYVLDLLVQLENGDAPPPAQRATLQGLPPMMNEAEKRASQLERRVVDIAEAWQLRDCVDQRLVGSVLDSRERYVELQLADPPVRARVPLPNGAKAPPLGADLSIVVKSVSIAEGRTEFALAD